MIFFKEFKMSLYLLFNYILILFKTYVFISLDSGFTERSLIKCI